MLLIKMWLELKLLKQMISPSFYKLVKVEMEPIGFLPVVF